MMVSEEAIINISALFAVGIITALAASYLHISREVEKSVKYKEKQFAETRADKLANEFQHLMLSDPQGNIDERVKDVKEFWKKVTYLDLELISEHADLYDIRKDLSSMRESFLLTLISFIITIALSMSIYSQYMIISFLFGIIILIHSSYKLIRILSDTGKIAI